MSYQVLALKYRPQTFEQVVGQNHVTTTLTNAITTDRVAHAILLTGPRGTGKTTIARILAKAMACSQGPTPTPCNNCKICTDIIQGHCSDVFEIDGASNNSVEQIRDLRENVTYMPAAARFKIYIIDEVHMLSVAAFNALLKTLEEPPDHVLFIFATTEVHKIPATILSRCQRHDLARISLPEISDHLAFLCQEEGFSLDRESLDLISLEADGSIRDGLSLLDRILSSSPEKIVDHKTVVDNLGVMDRQLMRDIACGVFKKDGAALIRLVDQVNDSGLDLKKFYADMITHFRNLNIIKICGGDSPSLNLIESEKQELFQTVADLPQTYLGMLLQLLLDQETLVRFSSHTQTAVEMVLLKLIQINPGAQLDEIISKLDILARQIDTQLAAPCSAKTRPEQPGTTRHNPPLPSQPAMVDPPPAQQRGENQVSTAEPARETRAYPADQATMESQVRESQVRAARASGQTSWEEFLTILQTKLPFIFALFSKGKINKTQEDKIIVELDHCSGFEISRLKGKDRQLKELSTQHLGKSIEVKIKTKASAMDTSQDQKAETKARQTASRHPMVQQARQLFDGEIL
ncbi:MAG: DNA polymerase III subunit gamma/tau [Desulfobacter sp.]|nr:DNA polymerase III subunit gamma/tau [Desulfobacter sp.]WDP86511.1 MAG: DNA polymerase III subunit gamma/tau [Desulfobacter sp.]